MDWEKLSVCCEDRQFSIVSFWFYSLRLQPLFLLFCLLYDYSYSKQWTYQECYWMKYIFDNHFILFCVNSCEGFNYFSQQNNCRQSNHHHHHLFLFVISFVFFFLYKPSKSLQNSRILYGIFFFFVVMLSFFFSFSILVTISQGTLGLPKAISWQWVGAENLLTQTKWQNIRINFWNSLIVDIVLCRFEISFKCNSRNYIETWPPSNSVWKSWLALLYFPHLKFAVREVMFRSKLESEWREKTNDLCNINSELNHSLGYETNKNFMNKQRISNVHYGVCIRCVCK